jgi:DNA-binding transcriptional MerR regulator
MTTVEAPLLRIGAAAAAAGVTPRTLRYYEQRGLLKPSAYTEGGERRYTEADVTRLRRVRELADLLGTDLEAIRRMLDAEDRLAAIRAEYLRPGQSPRRQLELLDEAEAVNRDLQETVDGRITRLRKVRDELRAKASRYADLRDELRRQS